MYNRLYRYLIRNNVLYCKLFEFQKEHFPDYAILRRKNLLSVRFLIYPNLVTQLIIEFTKNIEDCLRMWRALIVSPILLVKPDIRYRSDIGS